ncbi:hypothetical protein ACIA5D_50015 [Actinoplanes sp. NPDC051513]|uniref:allene oxide cyclase barrel-like domain-containing protein n=1 Tax=Actinoplanes sp. NPDC051513 TaxID=3363908 RepID=UPI0037BA086F
MNRILLSSLVAAAASLAIGAAAIASPPTAAKAGVDSATAHRDVLTFAVHFRPFPENFVDLGEPGPGIGDQLVFQDDLMDLTGRHVGVEGGTCVITAALPDGFQIECLGTISLADGQISYQGLVSNAPTKQLAIVGGTGRYRGASGEATLVELGHDDAGTLTVSIDRTTR